MNVGLTLFIQLLLAASFGLVLYSSVGLIHDPTVGIRNGFWLLLYIAR